jgi:hypothetical protein
MLHEGKAVSTPVEYEKLRQQKIEVTSALAHLWDLILNDVPCDPWGEAKDICPECQRVYAKVRKALDG